MPGIVLGLGIQWSADEAVVEGTKARREGGKFGEVDGSQTSRPLLETLFGDFILSNGKSLKGFNNGG